MKSRKVKRNSNIVEKKLEISEKDSENSHYP
jgi:hypothetical protein